MKNKLTHNKWLKRNSKNDLSIFFIGIFATALSPDALPASATDLHQIKFSVQNFYLKSATLFLITS